MSAAFRDRNVNKRCPQISDAVPMWRLSEEFTINKILLESNSKTALGISFCKSDVVEGDSEIKVE